MCKKNMDKFDIKKLTTELKKLNKESGKSINAGITIVTNNMEIYNMLLDNLDLVKGKNFYTLYQLSTSIFSQLKEFGIFPDKKKNKEDSKEDSFTTLVNKVNNVEKR